MQRASFAELLFLLHRSRLPSAPERRLLEAMLVAVADHGAGAPSCAAARLAASGNRRSLSAAIAAGLLTIGDEHGGAGEACMELIAAGVERASQAVGLRSPRRRIEPWSRRWPPGGACPVSATASTRKDPRVEVLFDMAREGGLAGDGVAFVRGLEAAARARIKPLPINVDGALAAVLHDLGFPPAAGQFLFIVGRVAGLTAEVAEEYAREKPMRIRIPVHYDGEPPRPKE